MSEGEFERLVSEAQRQPFSGWDFSWLAGRMREAPMSWDYSTLVRLLVRDATSLLDLGTGGGEVLSSLQPLPPRTVATEAYPPNVEIARRRLEPIGVEVVQIAGAPDNVAIGPEDGEHTLPFSDGEFSLIIDRHESYYPREVHRGRGAMFDG